MSTTKAQDCVDSAGRLAAFINEQVGECHLLDVLTWCVEANVALSKDTTTALEACQIVGGR